MFFGLKKQYTQFKLLSMLITLFMGNPAMKISIFNGKFVRGRSLYFASVVGKLFNPKVGGVPPTADYSAGVLTSQ